MSRRVLLKIKLPVLALLIVFFGCSSPLMEIVEEEVEVVTTPLALDTKSPSEGADNVSINTNISATFDKTVDETTVNTTNFYLQDSEGNIISGTAVRDSNTSIKFDPTNLLAVGTEYTVHIKNIKDTDGNTITDNISWSFTTGIEGDTSRPVINSVYMNSDDEWTTVSEVTVALDATDNFGVVQMNISFDNFATETGWIPYEESFTIELPEEDGEKTIYIEVKDGSNNVSETRGQDSINQDLTPPEIESFRIDYDIPATNTDTVYLDIETSDASGGSDPYQFRYMEDGGTWSSWIDLSSEGTGNVSDVPVTASDGSDQVYAAQVIDFAGNLSETAEASITYETTPPYIVSVFPEEDSSDYPSNGGQIYVSFSESMDPNSFNEDIFYLMQGSTQIKGTSVQYIEEDSNEIYPNFTVLLSGLEMDQNIGYLAVIENSVQDIAGNYLEDEYTWFYRTGDAIDDEPPVGTIALDTASPNHPTETITSTETISLVIDASDEYNAPYGIKIWGDNNDIALPAFEDDASWEAYTTTKTWTLSTGDGLKYLYYKFMDAASNETEEPIRLKLGMDTTAPTITNVILDNTAVYTNNQELTAELIVDAYDETSGIDSITIAVDGVIDTEEAESWIPTKLITLPEGDGVKTVAVSITDFAGLSSTVVTDTIIMDLTGPEIVFDETDHLNINQETAVTGTFTDDNPISTYYWEQIDGPGNLTFSDQTAQYPTIVPENTTDTAYEGEYVLQVTVTDAAGNSSFGTVTMNWDITAPGSPVGAAPEVTSDNTYSTSKQPEWYWDDVIDANYYKVSFAETPDWDTPDATGVTGYIITEISSFTPPEELTEGTHTLRVRAYDFAGNGTATGASSITVDTIFPAINNDGLYILENNQFIIDVSSEITEGGSGIASYSWTMADGPGLITFSASDANATDISADVDGQYIINLTVTDNAGNASVAGYTLDWDTTAPETPTVENLDHTPNVNPVWNWIGEGGGNGNFRYRLDRRARDWESDGGAYTGTAEVVFDWRTTENTSYAPGEDGTVGSLTDKFEYALYVEETDDAGNWSTSSEAPIWIDTNYTSEPTLSFNGSTLRNATETSITWSWVSGTGESDTSDYYRYQLNGTGWIETDANSWTENLTHGTNTFEIEERNISTGLWTGKVGVSVIEVDTIYPDEPSIASPTPTNDTTPTFTWSTGSADGIGTYMYRFDDGSGFVDWTEETQAESYTHTTALADTTIATIEVIERDLAGNWSTPSTHSVTIDITAPVPDFIEINNNNGYTNSSTVTLNFSASGSPTEMQFCNYSSNLGWGTWSAWESYSTSKTWALTSGDELKYALVQFKDAAGNVSSFIFDTITLDTAPPTVTSFSINNNSTSTSSYNVTLNSNVTGASTMYVRNGSSSGWTSYSYSSSRSWTTTTNNGAKLVQVYYVDAAGNSTSIQSDYIHYGQTNLYDSTKGETSNGYIYLKYDSYGTESGSNSYRSYFHTSPTSTPASGYSFYEDSTSTAPTFTGIPKGTLYYVYVAVNNSNAGLSDRFSNYMIAFTSNVTVIYDSYNSDDTYTAGRIKGVLEKTYFDPNNYSGITGTMPTWTVTLVPEHEVPNTWTSVDDRNIIYGDPIIITPHASYPYSYPNRARNISHRSYNTGQSPTTTSGKAGIVAMGYGGSLFLYRQRLNPGWQHQSSIGDQYQYPTEIGYGYVTGYNVDDIRMYTWTAGNSVWSSPLATTSFPGGTTPTHNSSTQITYTTAALATAGTSDAYYKRWSTYRANGSNPPYGYIYGRDYQGTDYYPVLRQGRFMQFGFPVLPNRPYTGYVYFVNLIARMDNY